MEGVPAKRLDFAAASNENQEMEWDSVRVKQLRLRLGLTQAEFARELGCRQQTISEWEQGIYKPANAYGRLLSAMDARAPLTVPAEIEQNKILRQKSKEVSLLSQNAARDLKAFFTSEEAGNESFDPAID